MEYYRKDSPDAFIYTNEEIKSFKAIQKRDVVDNFLLGDFNSDGFYCVDESIIKDLVEMTKIYIEGYANTVFCTSEDNFGLFGRISFAVKFFTTDEKSAEAHLQLLERISKVNGYYENTNIVTIAKFYGENDNKFADKAMIAFNIKKEGTKGALREFEVEETQNAWQNIIARKNYLKDIKEYSSKNRAKMQKQLFEERIKILSASDKGNDIKKLFNDKYDRVEDFFLDKSDKFKYFKALNELLDDIVASDKEYAKSIDYGMYKKVGDKFITSECEQIEKAKYALIKNQRHEKNISEQFNTENSKGGNTFAIIEVQKDAVKPVITAYKAREVKEIVAKQSTKEFSEKSAKFDVPSKEKTIKAEQKQASVKSNKTKSEKNYDYGFDDDYKSDSVDKKYDNLVKDSESLSNERKASLSHKFDDEEEEKTVVEEVDMRVV